MQKLSRIEAMRFGYSLDYGGAPYEEGVPCPHKGCLNHLTHPCEGCGRIGGKYKWRMNEKE